MKRLPNGPGVYRMIDAKGTVLYVGKARSLKKRVANYTRISQTARIARAVHLTATMEFVSTRTETEALLLEANLIKRLRPRFNVLLRDDKSFPYILITGDHPAPQLAKHRGARTRKGTYFGPFASAGAVDRTINSLERAFLLRSCSDAVFATRTRPCLLHQIKRCSAPCTGEISTDDYRALVDEAQAFLSGRSQAVREEMQKSMSEASARLDFEAAARFRDRLAALSHVQAHQGINPRTIDEADLFACHQDGGMTVIEVFFFRTGQNWGNRAYFPRADKSLTAGEVLGAFLAQFYDDKPAPKLILLSDAIEDQDLLAEALSERAGHKIAVSVPERGEKRELMDHALANAREALGRELTLASSQATLLAGVAERFGLTETPRRIDVFDNSHIMGTNAVGAMIVAGPEGFVKAQYRKFNIRSEDLTPGDDYGMMREVLTRRFGRLMREVGPRTADRIEEAGMGPWPDVVMDRRRPRPAGGRLRGLRRTRHPEPAAHRHLQGPRPRCRPRDVLHAGPRAVHAAAARPGALFRPAAARRGPPVRHRLAPGAAEVGYHPQPAGRNRRDRADPQTGASAPFRHRQGGQQRGHRRPPGGAGDFGRNSAAGLRLFPRKSARVAWLATNGAEA